MFSIITPTFNRQHTLHRVYDSLHKQTCRDFHWIIVDDASEDDTEQLVKTWKDENKIDIQYFKLPENKGKPNALNYGLRYCREPITVIADSDDSFEASSLQDIKQIWKNLDKTTDGNKICTIWTLVKDEKNQIVGDKFPKDFWQVDYKERILNRQSPVSGEKWHSWRTEILQEYGFFHNDNTKYIGESATWAKINKKYDFLCVNMVHRIYWHSDDGYMQQQKSRLKASKINYYTSYYQLKFVSFTDIIKYKYYRNLAFEYIKSGYFYTDKSERLNALKRVASTIAFLTVLPKRIFARI